MDKSQLLQEMTVLSIGLGKSILIGCIGIILGVLIGVVLGAIRHAKIPLLRGLVAGYVDLVRCTPLLVQIFLLYFGLPELGISLSEFSAAWLALALWGGAYQVEVMRAGFDAVPATEVRAARALGMSGVQAFLDVTLPLGIRGAIPAATTTAITQFRSSSFMIVIGYQELTFVANRIVSETFDVFRIFGMASLMYLFVSTVISVAARKAETMMSVPGLGVGGK